MKNIYLDNASTSFPKAPGVVKQMQFFMEEVGCNINRGGYEKAYSASETVLDTREKLCSLFHFDDSRNVIFTMNITMALNQLCKGLLKSGDHVLVSAMEHNAVMRPLVQLEAHGVEFDRIPCNRQGELILERLKPMIKPNTRAVILTHASNVCGTLMPLKQVGEICREHGLFFIVDSAQTAGVFPIDMQDMHIDALAFTGHKGLSGPQGIGGFLVGSALAAQLKPLIAGGTGSFSQLETMPELLPDKFEAGTPNLPGIYGLNAALSNLQANGIDKIRETELSLAARLTRRLACEKLRIVGVEDTQKAPIVSVDFTDRDNAEIAYLLDSKCGVMTRCGLHCAPNAHKTLGTYPQGTVRFSVSHFNTADEVDEAADCVHKILERSITDR